VAGALRAHAPPNEVGVFRRVGRLLFDHLPTPGYPSGRQQDLLQAQVGTGTLLRSDAGFAPRGSCGRQGRPTLLLTRFLFTRPGPKQLSTRAVERVVGKADAAVWLLAAVDVSGSGGGQSQQASEPEQKQAIHPSRIGGPAPHLDAAAALRLRLPKTKRLWCRRRDSNPHRPRGHLRETQSRSRARCRAFPAHAPLLASTLPILSRSTRFTRDRT